MKASEQVISTLVKSFKIFINLFWCRGCLTEANAESHTNNGHGKYK